MNFEPLQRRFVLRTSIPLGLLVCVASSCTAVGERASRLGYRDKAETPSKSSSIAANGEGALIRSKPVAGSIGKNEDSSIARSAKAMSSSASTAKADPSVVRSTIAQAIHDDQLRTVKAETASNDLPPSPDVAPAIASAQPEATETPENQGQVDLANAPLEEGDQSYPINLATALRLSDDRPLVIAAAQASAWVAEAQLQRAKVIWVPQLNMGADYIRHDGYGPDFNRSLNTAERPLSQNVNFLYAGAGMTTSFAAADAIFEPLAAKQSLNSKRWSIQTAKNDALLATAKSYFDVHQYRGQYAGALDVVKRGEKLVDRINQLSADLVPKVEVDRASRLLASSQQNAAMARQKWRVASANLTQTLRLDPRVIVDPAEHDHVQITLFDPGRPLDELIPLGLTNRPELSSNQAIVDSVAQRIRREKGRVLLPSIYINGFQTPNEYLQVGAQGFGSGSNLNLWSARNDISLQPVWQWEALGMGNMARIKEQRGEQSKAIVELFKVQDAVAGDVTRAQAKVQSAAARTVQAERAMREAIITFDGNYEGLTQTRRFDNILVQVYRPQEAVVALQDLQTSYDQYFATVADYNRAQFELYHAVGYPALEIATNQTAGEPMPTDTSRPHYMPAVEVGPPAATK